jgi:hypothetical protein
VRTWHGVVRRAAIGFTLASLLAVAACGDGDSDSPSGGAAATDEGGAQQTDPKCGLANGKPASGAPIKLGAIVTKTAGNDFTPVTDAAKGFFDCVNDSSWRWRAAPTFPTPYPTRSTSASTRGRATSPSRRGPLVNRRDGRDRDLRGHGGLARASSVRRHRADLSARRAGLWRRSTGSDEVRG